MNRFVTALAACALLLALGAPTAQAARSVPDDAYIVVLKGNVSDPAAVAGEHGRKHGAKPKKVWRAALKGYSARIPAAQVARLRADARVASVEREQLLSASATQTGATWGLDRIDQRYLPLNGAFNYAGTGAGVTAYVVDTGIHPTHVQFGGRAVSDRDFVDPLNPTGPYYNDGKDCNGHGTHVAGTIGGSTHGVAKGVSLVGVRVLDCDGYGLTSEIIDGINWVTADHDAGERAVANASLGGGASTAIDTAVRNSIADGVSWAVAAGNENRNACNGSPSRVSEAITIAASDRSDRRASFSNYGSCVDWFAPGVNITSAWHTGDTATATISGTSMATPHTAGAAALYLQRYPTATPAAVRNGLYNATTKYRIAYSGTANNHLLYTAGL